MKYSLYCNNAGVLSEHATLLNKKLRLIARSDSDNFYSAVASLSKIDEDLGVCVVPHFYDIDAEAEKLTKIVLFLCDMSRNFPELGIASKSWIRNLLSEIDEATEYHIEITESQPLIRTMLRVLEKLARALEESRGVVDTVKNLRYLHR